MKITVRPELKILYPRAVFGSLKVYNQKNTKQDQRLEDSKRQLEQQIRDTYPDPREDPVIQSYNDYYSKWEKTYPIEYQIKSMKAGRKFPRVSVHVDAMFMAELGNRILTSGHDQDAVKGDPVFDLADEGEPYTKLNGEEQSLKKNDVVLRDDEGVLASVLYGPARRTSIAHDTKNPLYFAWCPNGADEEAVDKHLTDIVKHLETVFVEVDHVAQIHE